jgi:hypothetical protein
MERHLNNETRRRASGRATQAAVAMKKLDALISGFADEIFRIIRGATIEELAELRGSASPAVREPLGKRALAAAPPASRRAAPWPPPRRLAAARWRRSHDEELEDAPVAAVRGGSTGDRARRRGAESASSAPNAHVVAEITDPESLLRVEAPAPSAHAEPAHETPPPISTVTEKPSPPSAPVPLRANEALVRASGAGIVIRRRKGA